MKKKKEKTYIKNLDISGTVEACFMNVSICS